MKWPAAFLSWGIIITIYFSHGVLSTPMFYFEAITFSLKPEHGGVMMGAWAWVGFIVSPVTLYAVSHLLVDRKG
jgi:hypothetical protein